MKTIFKEMQRTLDLDEVLVYRQQYEQHPELYSEVRGEVLLVCTNLDDPDTYAWIWKDELGSRYVGSTNMRVIEELLLCRTYTPDKDDRFGILITSDEYAAAPSAYVILKTVVVVAMKDFPHYTEMIELEDYRAREGELDLISVSHFVRSDLVR